MSDSNSRVPDDVDVYACSGDATTDPELAESPTNQPVQKPKALSLIHI